jgi:hypothetical protein
MADNSVLRKLALYDGRCIVRWKQYQAFAADGAALGEFPNQKSAAGAIKVTSCSSGSFVQPAEMSAA